jgi:glyoxylase-like metal-dependent hydrolase (beta-lactamase superfamily II)/ferredoxin
MKTQAIASLAMSMVLWDGSQAFVPSTLHTRSGVFRRSTRGRITTDEGLSMTSTTSTNGRKSKAPARFEDNVEGALYVNDACINCQACNRFAPSVFHIDERRQTHHVVYKQPDVTNKEEMDQARAALSACPVAAIRVDHKEATTDQDKDTAKQLTINEKLSGWTHPFPRAVDSSQYPNVYHLGHHNEHSFGAVPYLTVGSKDTVMVDTPKFNKSAVRTVESITGPEGPSYTFLTHVDDTADHERWAEHFPNMKRIFHSGDLGPDNWRGDLELENCEVLLHGISDYDSSTNTNNNLFEAWKLNGDDYPEFESSDDNEEFVVLHTPGHSRGSITLLQRPQNGEGGGIIFTGDTLGRSGRTGELTGFPRYGNNLRLQKRTLERFTKLSTPWDFIAPGHGLHRLYHGDVDLRNKEVEDAVEDLKSYSRY